MKRTQPLAISIALTTLMLACASGPPGAEHGPQGTIAYYVQLESSESGARIEVNNDYVGKTPMTLKIWGDKDGTFHNFGSQEYIIRAFPLNTNQFIQTKAFRTGGWFSQEDKIPTRLYFDLNQKSSGFSVDLPPKY